jgi:hypothetical protein
MSAMVTVLPLGGIVTVGLNVTVVVPLSKEAMPACVMM